MAVCALRHYNASSRGTILCRRSRFTALQLNDYIRKRRDCDRPVRKQIVESNELVDRSPAASAVERLMRYTGSWACTRPPKVRTTIPAEDAPPLPDLIGRRFAAGRPDVATGRRPGPTASRIVRNSASISWPGPGQRPNDDVDVGLGPYDVEGWQILKEPTWQPAMAAPWLAASDALTRRDED